MHSSLFHELYKALTRSPILTELLCSMGRQLTGRFCWTYDLGHLIFTSIHPIGSRQLPAIHIWLVQVAVELRNYNFSEDRMGDIIFGGKWRLYWPRQWWTLAGAAPSGPTRWRGCSRPRPATGAVYAHNQKLYETSCSAWINLRDGCTTRYQGAYSGRGRTRIKCPLPNKKISKKERLTRAWREASKKKEGIIYKNLNYISNLRFFMASLIHHLKKKKG